jgi:glycogen operon protein
VTLNGSARTVEVTLPSAPGATAYVLLWDSSDDRPAPVGEPLGAGTAVTMEGASMRVWRVVPATD